MDEQTQHEIIQYIMDEDLLFVLGMLTLGALGITLGTLTGMMKHLFRERTRREIAAYIAEGSMTPEQGVELMKARPKGD